MEYAKIACQKCKHKQKIGIPTNMCLPFYKCEKCGKLTMAKTCCVICDYSNKKCPEPHVK